MSKRDDLNRTLGGNVAESMGLHGAAAATAATGARPLPPRLQGLTRSKDAARIAVDRIIAEPGQPRTEFDPDALAGLAAFAQATGADPAYPRPMVGGAEVYIIVVVGERRAGGPREMAPDWRFLVAADRGA